MPKYTILMPAGLRFALTENQNGEWLLQGADGEERLATHTEVALWNKLKSEREEVNASRMRVTRLSEAMTDLLATIQSLQDEVAVLRRSVESANMGSRQTP